MIDPLHMPVFAALAGRLKFLSARASVIAENIANADTPGFAARDLEAPRFAARMAALKTSDPRHIGAASGVVAQAKIESAPDPEASLNGNRVSLETQMMKMSDTRMNYELASTLYRKGVELIRLAARGGR